jgi:thymidylate synthase (FAD)
MKIEYVTHMGDDLLVANAARKSFGVGFTEFRTIEDGPRSANGRSDEQLIYDLAAEKHWLPFRHPHVTVACSEALPIARQLGKHQVGMDWSEISRRYKTKDITFTYLDGKWRTDVEDRKQGSGDIASPYQQAVLAAIQHNNIKRCIEDYEYALSIGAAPEQARYLLPQSMSVEWTWTASLLAISHLYNQRNHKDAQKEAQEFALAMSGIAQPLYPISWRALTQ